MRSYVIDQLDAASLSLLCDRLDEMGLRSSMEGLYWLPVPVSFYTDLQKKHMSSCGTYSLGLEVLEESISLEMLVRAMGRMRCECVCFASPTLRDHMIQYLENLLAELHIEY